MNATFAELGSVAEFVNGAAFKPEDWGEHGRRIIRIQNLTDPSKPFNRTTREMPAKLHVQPGDLLVSWSASLGVFEWKGPDVALLNQHIFRVLPDERRIDRRYLRHALERALDHMQRHLHGATMQHVNRGEFLATKIYLPPLPEQRRIAEILDKADALRAKRRAALAQLDTLTQSIFLDMFGDPLTNPKGFAIKTLAEFYVNGVEGTRCGPFGSALKKSELVSEGIPVWNMDNIDPSGRMVLPFRMWISESKFRQLEAYAVADGDVVISRAGTVGKMCVAKTNGVRSIISTNLIRVRFGPRLLPLYFVSLMTHCKGRVGRLRAGEDGAFTHMNTGILDKLKFPYPPLDLQNEFARIVESIEEQKSMQVAQLAELTKLFSSLQQRVFRGELQA